MADIAKLNQAHVDFPEQVQYQERAEVPLTPFAEAIFPDQLDVQAVLIETEYAFHPEPQTPLAPSWYTEDHGVVDTHRPVTPGEFSFYPEPLPDAEDAPDLNPPPVYPDFLPPPPLTPGWFAHNLEPIPDFRPDLAEYPEWLDPIPYLEHFFTQNIEPLPDPAPAAPDILTAVFPDWIDRLPPPHPPSFFQVITPTQIIRPRVLSRGIYHPGRRGLYDESLVSNEPWCAVRGDQAVAYTGDGAFYTVPMTTMFNESGGTNADAWGMLESDGRVLIKRDGYYLVTIDADWGPVSSGGVQINFAALRARRYTSGVVQRRIGILSEHVDPDPSGREINMQFSSRPQPFLAGDQIEFEVQIVTDTGGDRDLETVVATVRRVFSSSPDGLVY